MKEFKNSGTSVSGFLYRFKVHAFNTGINLKQGRGFLAADVRVFVAVVVILLSIII